MNYAIPLYQCQKDETPGRIPLFSCTVEIGGIRYIGAAAKTKKEAEIKAARTALLAIQSSTTQSSEKPFLNSHLTVIPCKKRGTKSINDIEEATNPPKAKKARFKKKMLKKKLSGDKLGNSQGENADSLESVLDNNGPETDQIDAAAVQEAGMGTLSMEAMGNPQNVRSDVSSSGKEISAGEGALAQQVNGNHENGNSSTSNCTLNNDMGTFSMFSGDMTVPTKEMNEVSGFGDIASVADSATTRGHMGTSNFEPA